MRVPHATAGALLVERNRCTGKNLRMDGSLRASPLSVQQLRSRAALLADELRRRGPLRLPSVLVVALELGDRVAAAVLCEADLRCHSRSIPVAFPVALEEHAELAGRVCLSVWGHTLLCRRHAPLAQEVGAVVLLKALCSVCHAILRIALGLVVQVLGHSRVGSRFQPVCLAPVCPGVGVLQGNGVAASLGKLQRFLLGLPLPEIHTTAAVERAEKAFHLLWLCIGQRELHGPALCNASWEVDGGRAVEGGEHLLQSVWIDALLGQLEQLVLDHLLGEVQAGAGEEGVLQLLQVLKGHSAVVQDGSVLLRHPICIGPVKVHPLAAVEPLRKVMLTDAAAGRIRLQLDVCPHAEGNLE